MGFFDLANKSYTGTEKLTYALLYKEIEEEENQKLTDESKDLPSPQAIREKTTGSCSSINSKLKKMGINLKEFNYPDSKFHELQLLKCLYHYDKQSESKLFMIIQKASLQSVDNTSLNGTPYEYLNHVNLYGNLNSNLKKDLKSCISAEKAKHMEDCLTFSISQLKEACDSYHSKLFWNNKENIDRVKTNLPKIKKFKLNRKVEHSSSPRYTIFEAMYFKIILSEDKGREKDLLDMRQIVKQFSKFCPPMHIVPKHDFFVPSNDVMGYLKQNTEEIVRYILQKNAIDQEDISSVSSIFPYADKIFKLLSAHTNRAVLKLNPGITIAAESSVCLACYLQCIYILKKHKEIKINYKYYKWTPDKGSLFLKFTQETPLIEFYQLQITTLFVWNERRWMWGEEAVRLFDEIEDLLDNNILNMCEANDEYELGNIYRNLYSYGK